MECHGVMERWHLDSTKTRSCSRAHTAGCRRAFKCRKFGNVQRSCGYLRLRSLGPLCRRLTKGPQQAEAMLQKQSLAISSIKRPRSQHLLCNHRQAGSIVQAKSHGLQYLWHCADQRLDRLTAARTRLELRAKNMGNPHLSASQRADMSRRMRAEVSASLSRTRCNHSAVTSSDPGQLRYMFCHFANALRCVRIAHLR